MDWMYHAVKSALASWGYLAVPAALLAENAGLPLPGETVLVFAAFLAHKNSGLHLYWIIPIGIGAAILGDNLGFFVGLKLGTTFIRWAKKILPVSDLDVNAAKDLIKRRGSISIFFARFLFGFRTIAGPVAGTLQMAWEKFLVANSLGAITWVSMIAILGYEFASAFNTLLRYFKTVGWGVSGGMFAIGYIFWRLEKKKFKERQQHQHAY
jgi:membrane-associated protein